MSETLNPAQREWLKDVLGLAPTEAEPTSAAPFQGTPAPTLTIDPEHAEITPGKPLVFTVTRDDPDGTSRDITSEVTWASSDPSITIDPHGHATARPVTATATITATDPASRLSIHANLVVAAPAPAPALIRIVVAPPKAALRFSDPRVTFGDPAKADSVQFQATGFFADDSSHDITSRVRWQSSQPGTASIGADGKASAGSAPGTATITATDLTSEASGAAIGATATITVAGISSIAIEPAAASIGDGESRQFTAKVTFADGHVVQGNDVVAWSTSSQWLTVSPDGKAQAQGSGRVKLTASLAGATTSIDITIDEFRSVETGFGAITYYVREEKSVLPTLTPLIEHYTTSKTLSEQLATAVKQALDAEKKIGEVDIEADVKQNTPAESQQDAAILKGLKVGNKTLAIMFEQLQSDMSEAADNFYIAGVAYAAANDEQQARAIEKLARESGERARALAQLLGAPGETPKSGPIVELNEYSVLLAPFYAAFKREEAQLTARANFYRDQAIELQWAAASARYAAAATRLNDVSELIPKVSSALDEAQEAYETERKTLANKYDTSTKGGFKFRPVKDGIQQAGNTSVLAARAAGAATGVAAEARKFGAWAKSTFKVIDDTEYAERLMQQIAARADSLATQAASSREDMDDLTKRLQSTYDFAEKSAFEAPGTGQPRTP